MTLPPVWCLFFTSRTRSDATWERIAYKSNWVRTSQNMLIVYIERWYNRSSKELSHCSSCKLQAETINMITKFKHFNFSDKTSHVLPNFYLLQSSKELHKLPWAQHQYNQLPVHVLNEVLPTWCAHPLHTDHLPTSAWYNNAIINMKVIEDFVLNACS